MTRNKYRVSVAAFSRDGISKNPSLEATYGKAMYHWGIWVEEKGGKGAARLYHVQEHEAMTSAEGPIPGGWRFEMRDSDSKTSMRLVGRLLIGKMPAGKGFPEMKALLDQVVLPVQSSSENCIDWTVNAIRLLQSQDPAWAEEFNVDKFMDYAYDRIKAWYAKGWMYEDLKESYVARKF